MTADNVGITYGIFNILVGTATFSIMTFSMMGFFAKLSIMTQ